MEKLHSIERRIQTIELRRGGPVMLPRIVGRHLTKIRERIIARDGAACTKCGFMPYNLSQLEVDHVVPLFMGGQESDENRACLCKRCHRKKSDLEEKERLGLGG
jgi:5-methylcytosine-specific restriction endonuclease McrA